MDGRPANDLARVGRQGEAEPDGEEVGRPVPEVEGDETGDTATDEPGPGAEDDERAEDDRVGQARILDLGSSSVRARANISTRPASRGSRPTPPQKAPSPARRAAVLARSTGSAPDRGGHAERGPAGNSARDLRRRTATTRRGNRRSGLSRSGRNAARCGVCRPGGLRQLGFLVYSPWE